MENQGTIGKIYATVGKESREGFCCLLQGNEALTAAHIIEGVEFLKVVIANQPYKVLSWKRIRPETENPTEGDLASVRLSPTPPAELPRWELQANPPKNENVLIFNTSENWSTLAPRYLEGYQMAAMLPQNGLEKFRRWSGKSPTHGEKILTGASGGPWTQNGDLIAVTSRTVEGGRGKIQTVYGSGTWQSPARPWDADPPSPSWLLLAIALLLLAKLLAKRKRKTY